MNADVKRTYIKAIGPDDKFESMIKNYGLQSPRMEKEVYNVH